MINSVLFVVDVAQLEHAVIVQFSDGVARSRYLNINMPYKAGATHCKH